MFFGSLVDVDRIHCFFEVPVFLTYFSSFFMLSTSLMFSVGQISVGFSVGPHSDLGIVCTSCNLTVPTNYL